MYAVVEASGRQWKVEPGMRLVINRVSSPVGSQHTLDRVLFAHDGMHAKVGRPYVEGAQVICEVVEHGLGPKTISYHFRRRENWRKTVGHRQPLSRLLVKDIVLSGAAEPPTASAATQEPGVPAAKPRAAKARSTTARKTTRTRKASTHGA